MANSKKPSTGAKAVVTGAGSGIGRALAVELAARGGTVLCSDINLKAAQQTARQIGGEAVGCDVSQADAVAALARAAQELFDGGPTLMVNNAGIGVGGQPVGEHSLDDWRAALNVNLWGAIHGAHFFAPLIRQHKSGGILTIASAASFGAMPWMAAYNVSKAGALALSETLRAEMAGTGIHVTAVCPTFVKTGIVENGRMSNAASSGAAKLMARTGITPDRVARAALEGLDADRPYVLPNLDARALWMLKRAAPAAYGKVTRLVAARDPAGLRTPS